MKRKEEKDRKLRARLIITLGSLRNMIRFFKFKPDHHFNNIYISLTYEFTYLFNI